MRHEIGIYPPQPRSKAVDEFRASAFDLVVTVCDNAAESCPVWLEEGRRVPVGFPDPAQATGTQAESLSQFRMVRAASCQRIGTLLNEHEKHL